VSTGPVDDGGSEPSGSPKRRRAAPVGILAGGLVAAVLVTVAVVVVTGEGPKKADVKAAREAGRNLTKTAALALNGTYGAGRATFTVTAAGTARGIYRADGAQVSRSDSAMTTSKLLVRFSCRTGGGAWRWWSPVAHRTVHGAMPTFDATVNSAQDISLLLLTLTREQEGTS
jgi:hypothetical protein